jgi:hypothetical protein
MANFSTMTEAETAAYWQAYFSQNPIDYKNIGGLYPDIPEFTIPVESGNGSFINVSLMDFKRQQDELALRNGDISKLPKFEAAPDSYTDQQKLQHYLVRIKDVGKWVDMFVSQAVEFDKTLKAAGVSSGLNFGSLLTIGGSATAAVQKYSKELGLSENGAETAAVGLSAISLVGTIYSVLSSISAASEAQINAARGRYIMENLKYCTDIYKKYDSLIKSLLQKANGNERSANGNERSANETKSTTNVLYVVAFCFLLFALSKSK